VSTAPSESKIELMQKVGAELRLFGTEIDGLDARAAARFGLNRSDLRCLDVLSHSGPLSPSALAAAVRLSSGGLSISLGRLERAGYIKRSMDRDDRRRVTVEATQRTRKVEDEIFGPLLEEVGQLLGGYSARELTTIHQFLQQARAAVASAGLKKGS
jgi:DNA-binding MarR family transcriptional regulator